MTDQTHSTLERHVRQATRQRRVERRVRHDVADGAAVMAFSLVMSIALAGTVAIILSAFGGLW